MSILLFPIKMIGLVAAGVVLGVGWKLGSYLVKTVMEDEKVTKFTQDLKGKCCSWMGQEEAEPLWKRKFDAF
jgi:hypothetical protein